MPHTVLIVDSNPAALNRTAKVLRDAGYHVTATASFESAKWRLRTMPPDLLVTDVRLGEYNGIHLVIGGRTRDSELPAIVTDVARDRVLEHDATSQGALYLVKPVPAERLLGAARELVEKRRQRASTAVPRRWPRKPLAVPLSATLGEREGQALDISHGGLRLQLDDLTEEEMAAQSVTLRVQWSDVLLRVRPVWARRPVNGGSWWCGVEIDPSDTRTLTAWRHFVDSMN